MKLKTLALLLAGLLALPSAGHAALVTISGQGTADGDWNVTTVDSTSLPAGHASQVWWNNQDLARVFAEALGASLNYPNRGLDVFANPTGATYSPFFAWNSGAAARGPYFEARTMQNGGGSVNYANVFIESVTWAVAERATTPPPVPLPAAAWLLLSGLGGLGFLGRRRKA